MASGSKLEKLPDELLLEVCKYLLPIDVLQSFFGLNARITRLIKDYRTHVSLYKGSFAQCDYIYANVFPNIGCHIRTLVIDRLYSVLQVDLFYRHLGDQNLSNLFPRLEKLTLIAFRQETLLPFVDRLENFEHLVELNISKLFSVPPEHQSTVLKALLTANNNKIRSVIISDPYTCLCLDDLPKVSYPNITRLQIMVDRIDHLLPLFSAIPNVTQLDITLIDNDIFNSLNYRISTLDHLTHFRFVSIYRPWIFEDLVVLLRRISNVQYLSLQLNTFDGRFIDGQQILPLRESLLHLRQFDYGLCYTAEKNGFDRQSVLDSWPPSSIECLVDETSNADNIFAFIYIVSSCIEPFVSLEVPGAIMSKIMPPKQHDSQVEQLTIKKVSTVSGCLPVMARWHRAKELNIWFLKPLPTATDVTDAKREKVPSIPKMARLKLLRLSGSVPADFHYLSLIFYAASNLIRLDLNFDNLLVLLDNEEASRFVQQRIRALSINRASSTAPTAIREQEDIPRIAATFARLRHMYVDVSHIVPTIDSIITRILIEFNKRLVSLGADGPPSVEMKTDARKWLENKNIMNNMTMVHPTQFDAYFNVASSRLLVWT